MQNAFSHGAGAERSPRRRLAVALLLYDGMGPFHLAGPLLVFGSSGLGGAGADIAMCALEPGPVRTLAGFTIDASQGLEAFERADVVIVPGWFAPDSQVPGALQKALLRAHARGAHIVGSCLGVFVLAQAGLLDHRNATTHWMHHARLAQSHPRVKLSPNVLFQRDGRVWTAAGGASAIDLCLRLLQEQCGAASATEVAQRICSAPQRHGAQQQRIERPIAASAADDKIRLLLDWAGSNLQQTLDIESLARRVHMSVRSFTRRFRRITGTTCAQWLLRERLSYAQELLQASEEKVESIAVRTGFANAVSLRQHFKRHYGQTPRQYRVAVRQKTRA